MTIESPMFPPRADVIVFPVGVSREEFLKTARSSRKAAISSCRVEPMDEEEVEEIEFRSSEWKARKAEKAASRPVTAINSDLRKERQEVWRMAQATTRFWSARLEFEDAVSWAQRKGLPEGRSHPDVDPAERYQMVERYRAALVRQLLTPAFDANSVKWKETTFAKGKHKHTDIKPERIERAIANDEAWLAAHPTKRTGNVEACAKRRAFKEAMRQRIREIAATRNLSDEEIRPALKLKHQEIGHFCQAHGVNIGWLLEGVGPIFKPWPTS